MAITELVFELQLLQGKISGVCDGLHCCYINLLCQENDHNLFANVKAFVWRELPLYQPTKSGSIDPASRYKCCKMIETAPVPAILKKENQTK